MPEARDRLARPDLVYVRRKRPLGGNSSGEAGGSLGVIDILADEPEDVMLSRTPFRWGSTPLTGLVGEAPASGSGGVGSFSGNNALRIPRTGHGQSLIGSPATGVCSQNVFPWSLRGLARGRISILPSWYPRSPLQDITSVVRHNQRANSSSSQAIERRRACLGEDEGLLSLSPYPMDHSINDNPSTSTSGAQLEHDDSMITPKHIKGKRPFPVSVPKVSKISLDISNQSSQEPGALTPQKELLNNIDTVEKVVMEELRRLKRNPTARKVEREKRVRTLMTMR